MSEIAKMKATEEYQKILRDNKVKNTDQFLTEEQRQLLEEKEFRERKKKEYGK